MAIDTAKPGEAQKQEETKDPAKAGEDFIPLGGDEDFVAFGAASDAESDSNSDASSDIDIDTEESSFHPHRITLSQFRQLLSCYPTTVEQVHRRKIMLKLQPKPAKGSKSKAEKKAGSASAKLRGAALIQKTDFSPSELKHISDEVGKFLELDAWRYEGMPGIIAERMGGSKKGEEKGKRKGEGVFLNKDELTTVMDWKTKHGHPRPTLMGMLKSNQEKSIIKCTTAAIAALPTEDPMLAPNEAFPKSSLDALTPLRGVGTATASLILSIATASGDAAHQVPFYSDDLYLWLCVKDYPGTESTPKSLISTGGTESAAKPNKKVAKVKRPNGELNVKYNIHEYRQLWNASWELRQRLNRAVEEEDGEESDKRLISHNDIEKVAYVLRNIAVSGFYPDVDPEDILHAHAMQEAMAQEAAKAAAASEESGEKKAGKKRKRSEKDEGKKKKNSKKKE